MSENVESGEIQSPEESKNKPISTIEDLTAEELSDYEDEVKALHILDSALDIPHVFSPIDFRELARVREVLLTEIKQLVEDDRRENSRES